MVRRLLRGLALSFTSIVFAVLLYATAITIAAHAWTWMQLGLSALLVDGALGLLLIVPRPRRARWVALGMIVAGCVRLTVAMAPCKAREVQGALVETRYARPEPGRLWFQGVPERETIRLGARVGLSREEYAADGQALATAYDEIERAGLFARVESPLLDSWFFDREHFWLALPRRAGPVPLVVFVHGNGGIFQMYPYLLAQAAVDHGFAIAFPSNGLGLWHADQDAAARVSRVVEAVSREVPIARVMLVGLSAGGLAIFGAALHDPGRYRSMVAVSGVFPDGIDWRRLAGTRVLILHGTLDPRAGIAGARSACADMRRGGVQVELHEDAGKDHLALLMARDSWVPLIFDWLAAH